MKKKRVNAKKKTIGYKRVIAYALLAISFSFFVATQFMNTEINKHPVSYYKVMEVRNALKVQIDAAATSGSYRSIILPTLVFAEKVCIVDLNAFYKNSFLCQMNRVCDEWQKKQSNVFFIPSGDSFLLSDLVIDKPVKCFQVLENKLFLMLKQKDGKIFVDDFGIE